MHEELFSKTGIQWANSHMCMKSYSVRLGYNELTHIIMCTKSYSARLGYNELTHTCA